jgi:hypothetical protein
VHQEPIVLVDPFDLPEWLGVGDVTWQPEVGLRTGHHVAGVLTGGPSDAPESIVCDLLAVDDAYPAPVTDDESRARAHQAWRHGQVVVGEYAGRLTLAVPGTAFDPQDVLDALARLAKAVGASADHWAARLVIGADRPHRGTR